MGTDAKPRIKTLIDAGAATGLPFLLINADIEISGDHTLIEAAIESPEKLTIGIRYNHAPREPRGRLTGHPLLRLRLTVGHGVSAPDGLGLDAVARRIQDQVVQDLLE